MAQYVFASCISLFNYLSVVGEPLEILLNRLGDIKPEDVTFHSLALKP